MLVVYYMLPHLHSVIQKFGDVDLSSTKNAFMSIRHGTANKHATPPPVAPPVPAALPGIKDKWGPPPPRRVPSTSSSRSETKVSPPPPPPPPRPVVEEPEPEGEWAEAMYDYSSEVSYICPLVASGALFTQLRIQAICHCKKARGSSSLRELRMTGLC